MQRKLQNSDQGDCCMPCIRKINETTKHFKTFTHAPAYLIAYLHQSVKQAKRSL
ncbi:hypothetical protein NC652_037930 [Populus alba x Populus x berolinensis]|nr:hypothetical protein NC652_037930 [Populus alba x Populus x berolinensis]